MSAIVPWEHTGSSHSLVTVRYQQMYSLPVTASIASSSTALFTLGGSYGPGAILYHGYTVNSPANRDKQLERRMPS